MIERLNKVLKELELIKKELESTNKKVDILSDDEIIKTNMIIKTSIEIIQIHDDKQYNNFDIY